MQWSKTLWAVFTACVSVFANISLEMPCCGSRVREEVRSCAWDSFVACNTGRVCSWDRCVCAGASVVGEARAAGTGGGSLQLGNVFCEEIKLSEVVLMPEEKVGGGEGQAARQWGGGWVTSLFRSCYRKASWAWGVMLLSMRAHSSRWLFETAVPLWRMDTFFSRLRNKLGVFFPIKIVFGWNIPKTKEHIFSLLSDLKYHVS